MKNLVGKLKIIAEIGVNHNNNREIGKKLVHEAKKAGAHSVKFQTFKAETLTLRNTPKAPYQINNKKESHYEMLEKLELSEEASEEERHFLKGLNEEIEDGKVSTTYDNMVVAGKVREVQWKEPDPAYLASRLKAVGNNYNPPPAINKNASKQSLFKKQREVLRKQQDNAEYQLGSDPGLRNGIARSSVSNKTVKWEIKETSNPQTMPDSSIATKHGDEYEYKDDKAPSFSRGPNDESNGVQSRRRRL